jgi:hypothetical protein
MQTKNFKSHGENHLEINQLTGADSADLEHFICKICSLIVCTPVECKGCDEILCSNCVK